MCASSSGQERGGPGGATAVDSSAHRRTLVLGAGNETAGDDGFGPAVVRLLSSLDLPAGVELADGGILGVDLLARLDEFDDLILVDAIRASIKHATGEGGERGLELETGRSGNWVERPDPVPGEVVVFRLSEVELEDPDPRFSLHDLSLGGCITLARTLGLRLPEIRVVGFVLPSVFSLGGFGLSREASSAVSVAADMVGKLLTDSRRN
jgi:Ni,Fe-hydrogenase maturation factor